MSKKTIVITYLLDRLMVGFLTLFKIGLQASTIGALFGILNITMMQNSVMPNITPFVMYISIIFIGKLTLDIVRFIDHPDTQTPFSFIPTLVFYCSLLATSITIVESSLDQALLVFRDNLLLLFITWTFLFIWKTYHKYALSDTILNKTKYFTVDSSKHPDQILEDLKHQVVKPAFIEFVDLASVETISTINKPFEPSTIHNHQTIKIMFTFSHPFLFGLDLLTKTYKGKSL